MRLVGAHRNGQTLRAAWGFLQRCLRRWWTDFGDWLVVEKRRDGRPSALAAVRRRLLGLTYAGLVGGVAPHRRTRR